MRRTRSRSSATPTWCIPATGPTLRPRWGSFAFFGPLTVRVDLWDRGIAGRLMHPVVELFDRWDVRHAGLFTSPESPKHVALYNKYGFWPQQLTPVLSKRLSSAPGAARYDTFSAARERGSGDEALQGCRDVAETVYSGLDLGREIVAADTQRLGDTVLLLDGDSLAGFAACHCGRGTEAGSGACYVKFGAPDPARTPTNASSGCSTPARPTPPTVAHRR